MEDVVLVDRPMRADARRSRRRLLDAARELILEIGGEPTGMRSPIGLESASEPCTGTFPTE